MIIKFVFLALAASLVAVLLKDNFRSGAMMVSIAGCVCLLYICTNIFLEIKSVLGDFAIADTVDTESMSLIVKTLSVAYITSFGTDVCSDAGEKAIANALDTAGKMIMLSMAFPMLAGIFKTVSGILK